MAAKRPAKPSKPTKVGKSAKAIPTTAAVTRLAKESSTPVRGETKTLETPGPCAFYGATITMRGAPAGISQLGLEIDGGLVHLVRAEQLVAAGLSTANASGAFATHASYGNQWTVVFGWPYPVRAAGGVRLLVTVLEDVAAIELALIVGR